MVAASELFASTAQLVRLNDRKLPTGLASGMALRYSGVTYLLTVGHALVDGISLQLGNNLKGMACWPLQNGYYVLSSSQCFSLIRGCPFEKSWDLNDPSVVDAALFKLPEDCSPVRYIVIQGEGASQLPVKVFDVPEPGVKIHYHPIADSVSPHLD